ncbi:MAG: hypothetical protein MHPSP_001118 [Paramarteilia canceri]
MTGCNTFIKKKKRSIGVKEPYNKQNLESQLALTAKYALKSKAELGIYINMMRKAKMNAVELGKLPVKNPKRIVEENALIRHLTMYGILTSETGSTEDLRLENVLTLTLENFLDRRLSSVVWTSRKARNCHDARVLVNHGHITVNDYVCKTPSMLVRVDSTVDIYHRSRLVTKKPGRSARKTAAKVAGAAEE